MAPSDAIDINRPTSTRRFAPPSLVQEKATLTKERAQRNARRLSTPVKSSTSNPPRIPLFPSTNEERPATTQGNNALMFLLGEAAELQTPVAPRGFFAVVKQAIARPFTPPTTASSAPAPPAPSAPVELPHLAEVRLEESPLVDAPVPTIIDASATTEIPSSAAALQIRGDLAHQATFLQLRHALAVAYARFAISGTARVSNPPTQLIPAPRIISVDHTFDSSTAFITPNMRIVFSATVSDIPTETVSSSVALTSPMTPFERAIAQARAAGYHLHKPTALGAPLRMGKKSRTCSRKQQKVLHGDGLRRLVLLKNATVHPTPELKSRRSKNASVQDISNDVADIDYDACLRRIGAGTGEAWSHRTRMMPSPVTLTVRLWDPKRTKEHKVEVQLEKPLLASSPLRRELKQKKVGKDWVAQEQSRPLPRRSKEPRPEPIQTAQPRMHRRQASVRFGTAKGSSESVVLSSSESTKPQRRRSQVFGRLKAKQGSMSGSSTETLNKIRQWSTDWKRRAKLMTPKPHVDAARSDSEGGERIASPSLSSLSTLETASVKARQSGWSKLKNRMNPKSKPLVEEETIDEVSVTEQQQEVRRSVLDAFKTSTKRGKGTSELPSMGDAPASTPASYEPSPDSPVTTVQLTEDDVKAAGSVDEKRPKIPLLRLRALKAFERQAQRS